MRQSRKHWSTGVTERWSNDCTTPLLHYFITPSRRRRSLGFALYEVLIGVTIFAIGVVALGRAVENCLNASALSAEEGRVREILWNRMAEIQTTPGRPDVSPKAESRLFRWTRFPYSHGRPPAESGTAAEGWINARCLAPRAYWQALDSPVLNLPVRRFLL